jgi:hypothetical protein
MFRSSARTATYTAVPTPILHDALPPLLFETYDNNQPGVPNDLLGSEDHTHTNGLNTAGLDETIEFEDLFDFETFNALQFPIQLPELGTDGTHSESPLLHETNFDRTYQTEQRFATFNDAHFGPLMDDEILQPNMTVPLDKPTSNTRPHANFSLANRVNPIAQHNQAKETSQ